MRQRSYSLCFLMLRRPPRSTHSRSSAASDVYKRQLLNLSVHDLNLTERVILVHGKGSKQRCLLYTSPSARDRTRSRMPSSD